MATINSPLTIYRPTSGNGEATIPGTKFLIDTSGAYLVDTTGTFVVDTGTDMQSMPLTIWLENDGA